MKKYITLRLLWLGLVLLPSSLQSQTVNLNSFQDVQLLNVQDCAVVQVNASWNYGNRVRIEQLSNICHVAEIDIENKTIGSTVYKEWNIKVVPTIIVLERGVEVKRFEPGISMKFDEYTIISDIKKQIQ